MEAVWGGDGGKRSAVFFCLYVNFTITNILCMSFLIRTDKSVAKLTMKICRLSSKDRRRKSLTETIMVYFFYGLRFN